MTRLLILSLLMLVVGCDDRYRYYCQDPKNFSAKRCQKPDCLFTQDCPDSVVAPILEKKVDPTQSPASAIPNN